MLKKNPLIFVPLFAFIFYILQGCAEKKPDTETNTKNTAPVTQTAKPVEKAETSKPGRPPVINIVDTVAARKIIVFTSDSAASFDRIGMKLADMYGRLLPFIETNKLKTMGMAMAWYKTQKAPYFFEAGFQVNKIPAKTAKGIKVKVLNAGPVVVAHFYGPYNMMGEGYTVLKEWIKENKKKIAGAPYEVYITAPVDKDGKPLDPYKVQTDIIFPVK